MSRRFARWVVLAAGLWLASAASAQDEEDPAESRAETFQAVEGPQTEDVPGGPLMVAAYGLAFALLLGYVVSVGRRQVATERALDELRRQLAAAGDGEGDA